MSNSSEEKDLDSQLAALAEYKVCYLRTKCFCGWASFDLYLMSMYIYFVFQVAYRLPYSENECWRDAFMNTFQPR